MRIVLDYRPALRARTGVGETVHQLARALRQYHPDDALTLFTSSWKDRPDARLSSIVAGAKISDHRVPVRLLNLAWHRAERPRVEWFTGERYDVAFSPHPLLLPARAAQVVMIHDLDFLEHPERAHGEIRRDYPRLASAHAKRADAIVVPSEYTARKVQQSFELPRDRIFVCPPGLPEWQDAPSRYDRNGYLLFLGTLEPRKNVPALLSAYADLLERSPRSPRLVLAGRAGSEAAAIIDRVSQPPLAGRVEHLGYVADSERLRLFAGARALVLPSLDEGFGMPALEAMSLGVPVVASNRGALTELVADAGLLIDPEQPSSLVEALDRVLTDDGLADTLATRGLARASGYSWRQNAAAMRAAFAAAVRHRASSQAS
jgi:glycosyltransferase involved in cell wall biosynthesis